MQKIFDLNNPFWTFISRFCDAFLLHLCWMVCCLPVVTFGAATSALYYAMMKDVADEETHYIRAFFRAFKENLKQGIPLGLIYIAVAALLLFAWDFYALNETQSTFFSVAKILAIAAVVLYLFSFVYVFALQARFINPVRQTIKNAFLLSIKHIGWTILMVIVQVAPYAAFLIFSFFPILLIGEGLVALINSYMLNHILEPYIKATLEKEGVNTDNPDHWEIPEEAGADGENAGEEAEAVEAAKDVSEESSEDASEES